MVIRYFIRPTVVLDYTLYSEVDSRAVRSEGKESTQPWKDGVSHDAEDSPEYQPIAQGIGGSVGEVEVEDRPRCW